jgi:hypothetical protein
LHSQSTKLAKNASKSLVMFEHAVRVPQPPDQSSNAGNLAEVADWGRLFFGYFLLAKQKKVTSCRATPDGVDFIKGVLPYAPTPLSRSLNLSSTTTATPPCELPLQAPASSHDAPANVLPRPDIHPAKILNPNYPFVATK